MGIWKSASMESPCVLICQIDDTTGYCYGCGRTRAEISDWIGLGDAKRRAVMETLPGRLAQIERRPRRVTRRQMLEERRRLQNEGGMP
jgi:uncharacterized protein